MKKRAIVFIDIDLTGKPESSSTSHKDVGSLSGVPRTVFVMSIRKSDPKFTEDGTSALSMRTILAHELGHVVASLVETKANADDPRCMPVGNRLMVNADLAVRASEREAWEIAREIEPNLDGQEANKLLATYADPELGPELEFGAQLEQWLPSVASLTVN